MPDQVQQQGFSLITDKGACRELLISPESAIRHTQDRYCVDESKNSRPFRAFGMFSSHSLAQELQAPCLEAANLLERFADKLQALN